MFRKSKKGSGNFGLMSIPRVTSPSNSLFFFISEYFSHHPVQERYAKNHFALYYSFKNILLE